MFFFQEHNSLNASKYTTQVLLVKNWLRIGWEIALWVIIHALCTEGLASFQASLESSNPSRSDLQTPIKQ